MNETTKTFLIAVGVIVGAFAAIVLWSYMSGPETKSYNNFEFTKQGPIWVTEASKNGQPYKLPFHYHSSAVEDVAAPSGIEQPLLRASMRDTNATVFVTVPPTLSSKAVIAGVEISRLTGSRYKILNLTTHGALTAKPDNPSASAPRPVVTCEQASYNNTFVIRIRKGPNNVITRADNGCIILEGKTDEDIIRVADRFAYMLLGIME
ncbi:MAG: hypothetical protein ABEI52_13365 [Halobacteriaceae archaeon]